MATVRLEFDLDSDVYPELHAALSGIRSARARAERFRQLAAAGLVWENVRLYGAAAIGPTPVDRAAPLPERSRPKPPPRPVDTTQGADFVDLAIDAEPVPRVVERRKVPRSAPRAVEPAPRELPVLMDVVPDDEVEDSRPGLLAPTPLLDEIEPPELPEWARGDDVAEVPPDLHPLTPLAEKPHTRSRLMRMKERGLFKNG